MRRNHKHGLFALICAGFALSFAFIVTHANLVYLSQPNWFVLTWLDMHGFIKQTSVSVPALTQASLFTLTEKNAIFWGLTSSVVFASYSILAVCAAEFHREHTLFYSAAFVVACCAIILINFKVGLLVTIAVFAVLMAIRDKKSLSSHSSGTPDGAP